MAQCTVCGADGTDPCPYCARAVCPDHRRVSRHACTGPPTGPATPHGGADADRGRDPIRAGIALVGLTVVLATTVLVATSLAPATGVGPAGGPNETAIETFVHAFANEERRASGLAPLDRNATLDRMAHDHSTRMARESTFGHGDEPLGARYERYGLACLGAENIYAVATVGAPYDERALARRTVEAWMESAGHRENLLGDRFTAHGIGVAVARAPGRTTVYVTQDFC